VRHWWGPKITALIDTYGAWQDEMNRRHLPLDWVLAMIVDGMAPAEVDWRTHHENDWAANRLIKALDLFGKIESRR
jgi:hypothetical protein